MTSSQLHAAAPARLMDCYAARGEVHLVGGFGMPTSRRRFLGQSVFALAGATAGAITLSGCASLRTPTGPAELTGPRSAGVGWTVNGLENHSAFAYFEIAHALTLGTVQIDASLLPAVGSGAANFTQALCRAWVSRGAPPPLNVGGSATGPASRSDDFGSVSIYNPNGLTVNSDGNPLQDVFYSAILRSWVPTSGVDPAAARSVYGLPSLALNAGDYLVFGIDQCGVPGSVQLQAVLDYE
jgi:hypothetical protein